MPFTKNDTEIICLDDWELLAGPKSRDQWVSDRSAMELAKAWLHDEGTSVPEAVARMLGEHQDFGPIIEWQGEPEAKLPFDHFPGETRNTDILVIARDRFGRYVLAVEGKADEPFASLIAETLAEAVERKIKSPHSKGVDRVIQLAIALFGEPLPREPKIGNLRYQLLTATAGAICEAERQGTDRAVLLIHEFVTKKTSDGKHQLNAADLDRFVQRLSRGGTPAIGARLQGPFVLPGAPLFGKTVRLYIGKVTENLRHGAV
jgi:hypothetical protein